jgi:hypothetical protein
MNMPSPLARNIPPRRFALILAPALLSCGTAFAADSVADAQARARALLAAAPADRTNSESIALPAGDASAPADARGQARWLLARLRRYSAAEMRGDAIESNDTSTSATSVESQRGHYAGPQESARKMILGSGA